jgi:hypothetical protein
MRSSWNVDTAFKLIRKRGAREMKFTVRALLIASLVGVPAPTIAQSTRADDIVVRAKREQERKAATTYVTNVSRTTDGQLARFHQPICVSVIGGLPREHAAIVEDLIRDVATAAGIPVVRKNPCAANFIVAIAVDGVDLVKDMEKARPDWLTGLGPEDVKALTAPGPARAWSITSLRNETGEMISPPRMTDAIAGLLPEGRSATTRKSQAPLADVPVLRVRTSSIVTRPDRQDIEASFVVIDRSSINGLTLRQLAGYAAMRGLGHTRPPAPGGGVSTVLSVLDGTPNPPRALTVSDATYLKALYSSDGRRIATVERSAIARRIAEESDLPPQ